MSSTAAQVYDLRLRALAGHQLHDMRAPALQCTLTFAIINPCHLCVGQVLWASVHPGSNKRSNIGQPLVSLPHCTIRGEAKLVIVSLLLRDLKVVRTNER